MLKGLLFSGIFAGGLVFAGTVYTGTNDLNSVKTSLTSMKTEFVSVVADNNFLKQQFGNLEGLYSNSVEAANGKIGGLVEQRDLLNAQVSALKKQLQDVTATEADKIALQNEVTRLEGQITLANTEAAALKVVATEIDASTTYVATVKADYTAEAIALDEIPVSITPEALALDETKARLMASTPKISFVMGQLQSTLPPASIVGVTTYTSGGVKYLAYEVAEKFAIGQTSISEDMKTYIGTELGYNDLYFVKGTFVASASKWGQFEIIRQ